MKHEPKQPFTGAPYLGWCALYATALIAGGMLWLLYEVGCSMAETLREDIRNAAYPKFGL